MDRSDDSLLDKAFLALADPARRRIIARHVLPNIVNPLIVAASSFLYWSESGKRRTLAAA